MNHDTLDPRDILALIRRNASTMFLCVALAVAAALLLANYLPERYKSRSVLNIQSSYFQNPMIAGVVNTVENEGELKAQRESMLRLALSESFIDRLAEEHGIYSAPAGDHKRAVEREVFRSNIDYYALSPSTFEVVVTAKTADMARAMNARIIARMQAILIHERQQKLENAKQAIESHLQTIGTALAREAARAPIKSDESVVALRESLGELNAQLTAVSARFTEVHPRVIGLKGKIAQIEARLSRVPAAPSAEASQPALAFGSVSKEPTQQLFNDLTQKLSFLSIVLAMEKGRDSVDYLGVVEEPTLPIAKYFPNRRIFIVIGAVVGALFGMLLIFLIELGRRAQVAPKQLAEVLEFPHFGDLPRLGAGKKLRLIEGPSGSAVQKQLPVAAGWK